MTRRQEQPVGKKKNREGRTPTALPRRRMVFRSVRGRRPRERRAREQATCPRKSAPDTTQPSQAPPEASPNQQQSHRCEFHRSFSRVRSQLHSYSVCAVVYNDLAASNVEQRTQHHLSTTEGNVHLHATSTVVHWAQDAQNVARTASDVGQRWTQVSVRSCAIPLSKDEAEIARNLQK